MAKFLSDIGPLPPINLISVVNLEGSVNENYAVSHIDLLQRLTAASTAENEYKTKAILENDG